MATGYGIDRLHGKTESELVQATQRILSKEECIEKYSSSNIVKDFFREEVNQGFSDLVCAEHPVSLSVCN